MSIRWNPILGIEKDVNEIDVRKAYRRKAVLWKPDRLAPEEAHRQFKILSEAYEILSDPVHRKIYDRYGKQGVEIEINRKKFAPALFEGIKMIEWRNIHNLTPDLPPKVRCNKTIS